MPRSEKSKFSFDSLSATAARKKVLEQLQLVIEPTRENDELINQWREFGLEALVDNVLELRDNPHHFITDEAVQEMLYEMDQYIASSTHETDEQKIGAPSAHTKDLNSAPDLYMSLPQEKFPPRR
jgi:hypothetical protein